MSINKGSFFFKNVRKLSPDSLMKLLDLIDEHTLAGAARLLKSSVNTLEVVKSGGSRKVSTVDRLEKALNDIAM